MSGSTYVLLGIGITFLFMIDIWTTNTIINRGGWEINPVMSWCMKVFGKWWFIPKIILTIIGLVIFKMLNLFVPGLIFVVVMYIITAIWNIKNLKSK